VVSRELRHGVSPMSPQVETEMMTTTYLVATEGTEEEQRAFMDYLDRSERHIMRWLDLTFLVCSMTMVATIFVALAVN